MDFERTCDLQNYVSYKAEIKRLKKLKRKTIKQFDNEICKVENLITLLRQNLLHTCDHKLAKYPSGMWGETITFACEKCGNTRTNGHWDNPQILIIDKWTWDDDSSSID